MPVVKTFTVGEFKTNCYLLEVNKSLIIIDPGDESDYISDMVERNGKKPSMILLTHGHSDHSNAALDLSLIYNIPVYLDKRDLFLNRKLKLIKEIKDLKEESVVNHLKNIGIEVIPIPGHTPGSQAFYLKEDNILFVGDLIFADGYLGRTDYKYSKKKEFNSSLKKIFKHPSLTTIYSGHGDPFLLGSFKLNSLF